MMRRRQILGAGAKKRPSEPQIDPVKAYEAKFGKPPHHRMKLKTILERINDTSDKRAEERQTAGPRQCRWHSYHCAGVRNKGGDCGHDPLLQPQAVAPQ